MMVQTVILCTFAPMASIKPSVPKGTRDFSPAKMAKRNYIFDTIKSVFRKYGYQQIETPAMENLSTLMGKYGDEGDKLIFKISNNGEKFYNEKKLESLYKYDENGRRGIDAFNLDTVINLRALIQESLTEPEKALR